MPRFVGLDLGAETVKAVELVGPAGALAWSRRARVDHRGAPGVAAREILRGWGWDEVAGACATGRLARQLRLERPAGQVARAAGFRFLHGRPGPGLVVDVGARGFSILELDRDGRGALRENARCSQGTGSFLRQLLERFGLGPDEADRLVERVPDAAQLSARCPVILKSELTHLANAGEPRERLVAGLFDAICEQVQAALAPREAMAVTLAGGVGRSRRVRARLGAWLAERGMTLAEEREDDGLFLDAVGCACLAAASKARVPALGDLVVPPGRGALEERPPLAAAASRVRRLAAPAPRARGDGDAVLGLDVGSTGSKAVLLEAGSGEVVWEDYVRTGGDPLGAAQSLVRRLSGGPAGRHRAVALGVTGSGRELVGALLASCYGTSCVHVVNEIAAHAAGALAADPRVDTIFEIGGQDAKFIRLADGHVVDAALNEACSAGTGSFIEEQGRRLGIPDVQALDRAAMQADGCVALGQHCSVFMAEILDEAVAAGVPLGRIVAGLYDAVVQNYLNRVKGSRAVGEVVFCQGMPFASDALAAAVARQTGAEVVVPPGPGTIGALGIALLARAALRTGPALDLGRFLEARVERRDAFVCRATRGCGGTGSACRIDRLRTRVGGERRAFSWGGACALHDRGAVSRKLPDAAPDPFRERRELVDAIARRLSSPSSGPRVAIAEAFQLKGLFPFFARFFRELGLGVEVIRPASREALRRGIEAASVPFCAPMQQYLGAALALAESGAGLVFLPMLRELPAVRDEAAHWLCPVVAGSADVARLDLAARLERVRVLSPVIRFGPGPLDGPPLLEACRALAAEAGAPPAAWRAAHAAAREEQLRFDAALLDLGRTALERCRAEGLLPVVVLGRAYAIHDPVLGANVPALLRAQGAVPIPLDCFPVEPGAPLVPGAFWSHGQRILRAADAVRRAKGVYGLFTTNYGCGPDSFTLHAFARAMQGKPFAVIETDGHAGDAGTKTRVEVFLHCVREDLRTARSAGIEPAAPSAPAFESLAEIARRGATVLVPSMGPEAQALAAALRGTGVPAEVLPPSTPRSVQLGRRHTSGKECLPFILTLGSLLERLERAPPDERLSLFMPGSSGPCRFGCYRGLHEDVLRRLGHAGRVRLWSPPDSDYFEGVPPGFAAVVFAGIAAFGLLEDALRDVRPVERDPGEAARIHARFAGELTRRLERAAAGDLSALRTAGEVLTGRCWGVPALLARAGRALRAVKSGRPCPTVLLVGEVYVRSDASANGFVADELERRGVRVRTEPVVEFLAYSERVQRRRGRRATATGWLRSRARSRILGACREAVRAGMGWPPFASVADAVAAAAPYLREDLEHEAVMALGLSLVRWRRGEIDGALCVGPLECMPDRLVEAQLAHARRREGLLSMTLSLNGDPVNPERLDAFAHEVKMGSRPST